MDFWFYMVPTMLALIFIIAISTKLDQPQEGISCDVTDPAQVSRLAKLSESSMGIIDVWINNAGYSGGKKLRRKSVGYTAEILKKMGKVRPANNKIYGLEPPQNNCRKINSEHLHTKNPVETKILWWLCTLLGVNILKQWKVVTLNWQKISKAPKMLKLLNFKRISNEILQKKSLDQRVSLLLLCCRRKEESLLSIRQSVEM
eukprot:TRINITY_DN4534_c1_g2_i2.p1 TRINITY_DN4534_c1_g2~~TRINITY_DN4534_c1_g2_i2.p1  ORF type:complete len:202 (-),score=5.16 TRINITY_DN4534_c1_g2_i2:575-1180(-)